MRGPWRPLAPAPQAMQDHHGVKRDHADECGGRQGAQHGQHGGGKAGQARRVLGRVNHKDEVGVSVSMRA